MNFNIEGRQVVDDKTNVNAKGRVDEIIACQNFSDLWVGLTWSYKFNQFAAFGVTHYLAIGNQKSRMQGMSQVLQLDGELYDALALQQFNFSAYRYICKLGMGVNFDPLTIGLTFTNLSLHITGRGTSYLFIDI